MGGGDGSLSTTGYFGEYEKIKINMNIYIYYDSFGFLHLLFI